MIDELIELKSNGCRYYFKISEQYKSIDVFKNKYGGDHYLGTINIPKYLRTSDNTMLFNYAVAHIHYIGWVRDKKYLSLLYDQSNTLKFIKTLLTNAKNNILTTKNLIDLLYFNELLYFEPDRSPFNCYYVRVAKSGKSLIMEHKYEGLGQGKNVHNKNFDIRYMLYNDIHLTEYKKRLLELGEL